MARKDLGLDHNMWYTVKLESGYLVLGHSVRHRGLSTAGKRVG